MREITKRVSENKNYISWEETIILLRNDQKYRSMIYDSYLGPDLYENCQRFTNSYEFKEVIEFIKKEKPDSKKILDLAAGNGIATYAFAKNGFEVTALEPDPSITVGRGAIESIAGMERQLKISVYDGFGESMPFEDSFFDIVYLRQALHHSKDLKRMIKEVYRVLKPGGLFFSCREHVVDNYKNALREFLDSQIDHQYYGGEYAYRLKDYLASIRSQKFQILSTLGPYDSDINLHPGNYKSLKNSALNSSKGNFFRRLLGERIALFLMLVLIKRRKVQGRLYTFIAKKGNNGV